MCPGIKYDFHSMVMDMWGNLIFLLSDCNGKVADDIAKAATNVEKHKKLTEDEMERLKKENEDIKNYYQSITFLEDQQNYELLNERKENINSKILQFASNKTRMETQTDMLDHVKTAIKSNDEFIFWKPIERIILSKWIFLAVYEKKCDDKEEISRKIRKELFHYHRMDYTGEILFLNIVFLVLIRNNIPLECSY